MVPRVDNDLINSRSRSDFSFMTPGEQLTHILNRLSQNDEELIHLIKRNQIDVNAFGDDAASGTVTVTNPIRRPLLITDIIATWNVASPTNQVSSAPANPAAGASYVYTNTSGQNQTLLSISGTFTASATVASRFPGIQIKDAAGNVIFQAIDLSAVVASTNATLFGSIGATQANAAAGTVILPLPQGIVIPPNGTVTLFAQAMQATDTWTGITQAISQTVVGTGTITFGGRTFQLNYSTGLFNLSSTHGFQLENLAANAKVVLTITPATAVHLEVMGMADYRKVERL